MYQPPKFVRRQNVPIFSTRHDKSRLSLILAFVKVSFSKFNSFLIILFVIYCSCWKCWRLTQVLNLLIFPVNATLVRSRCLKSHHWVLWSRLFTGRTSFLVLNRYHQMLKVHYSIKPINKSTKSTESANSMQCLQFKLELLWLFKEVVHHKLPYKVRVQSILNGFRSSKLQLHYTQPHYSDKFTVGSVTFQ